MAVRANQATRCFDTTQRDVSLALMYIKAAQNGAPCVPSLALAGATFITEKVMTANAEQAAYVFGVAEQANLRAVVGRDITLANAVIDVNGVV